MYADTKVSFSVSIVDSVFHMLYFPVGCIISQPELQCAFSISLITATQPHHSQWPSNDAKKKKDERPWQHRFENKEKRTKKTGWAAVVFSHPLPKPGVTISLGELAEDVEQTHLTQGSTTAPAVHSVCASSFRLTHTRAGRNHDIRSSAASETSQIEV